MDRSAHDEEHESPIGLAVFLAGGASMKEVDQIIAHYMAHRATMTSGYDVVPQIARSIESVVGPGRENFDRLLDETILEMESRGILRGSAAGLIIQNDGPLIVATNYWESEFARHGLIFLSTNAGALRLLVPPQHEPALAEMASAKLVIASRPRNPGPYAFELLFEDGTDSPFCLHLDARALDRLLPKEDDGRKDLEFTAWTQPRRGEPHEALRRPASFRFVPRLPWARRWDI